MAPQHPKWPSHQNTEYISTYVAGLWAERRRIRAATFAKVGDLLILIREPSNPYDCHAIQVWLEELVEPLGYVPRHEAAYISPRVDDGFWCAGYIRKIEPYEDTTSINIIIGLSRPGVGECGLRDQLLVWRKRYLQI
ncbi:HIRAN domain-containing protein [Planctomicrobium sp. SH664]|uniref:HIRAN domain-containing protein n=1 Tax=Planctomicrobium sp. SH664 TaxID=3448125 RepID=UPI003F5BF2E8